MSREDVQFISEQIYGWVGNLMRDADAKGHPFDIEDVATALEEVAYAIDAQPTKDDFDEFLHQLNEGEDNEGL